MINVLAANSVDEEHVMRLRFKLAQAIQSGDQTAINSAFFVASLNYQIPLENRSQLIGEAMDLLKEINADSARQATAYIVGVPVAALGV